MDNSKNGMKDKPKSDLELRKMKSRENSDVGIINDKRIRPHDAGFEKTKEDMR